MCVHVCVFTCLCLLHVCLCICVCMCVYMCVHTNLHARQYNYTCACACMSGETVYSYVGITQAYICTVARKQGCSSAGAPIVFILTS